MSSAIIKFSLSEKKKEDTLTLKSFLASSCTGAQQFLKEGTSFIKEELTSLYTTAESRLQKMTLPINNFLKDMIQLDLEIEYESKKQCGLLNEGNFVPLEEALKSPMEENY